MQPLEEMRAGIDGLADDVDGIRARIDDGSARYAHLGSDVAKSVAHEPSGGTGRDSGFARCSAVGGIEKIGVPERGTGAGVSIEGIHTFVLRVPYGQLILCTMD